MVDLNNLVEKYIADEITLSQKDIEDSVKSREWVLEKIQATIESKTNQPILLKEKPYFIYGSYIKGTKVTDVDEFDVMLVLDSCNGIYIGDSIVLGNGQGYADPNPKYSGAYHKDDNSGVSPRKMLSWVKGIAKEALLPHGVKEPYIDRHAVVIEIANSNIKMELVPAGRFTHTGMLDSLFYNIPQWSNDSWVISNPHDDIELIKKYAEGRDNFKNIIRLIKHIVQSYNMSSNIKSFSIECLVVDYVRENSWYNYVGKDLYLVLKYFAKALSEKLIEDSFDNNVNLLSEMESATANWYSSRILDICTDLEKIEQYDDYDAAYNKLVKVLSNE